MKEVTNKPLDLDQLELESQYGAISQADQVSLVLIAQAFEECVEYFDMGHINQQLLEPFWKRYFAVAVWSKEHNKYKLSGGPVLPMKKPTNA